MCQLITVAPVVNHFCWKLGRFSLSNESINYKYPQTLSHFTKMFHTIILGIPHSHQNVFNQNVFRIGTAVLFLLSDPKTLIDISRNNMLNPQ